MGSRLAVSTCKLMPRPSNCMTTLNTVGAEKQSEFSRPPGSPAVLAACGGGRYAVLIPARYSWEEVMARKKETSAAPAITVRPSRTDDFAVIEKLFGANGACGGCGCMAARV